jgi:threonine dehydratase
LRLLGPSFPARRFSDLVEGAAAAPVAALLHGLIKMPPGARVVAVLSGGNLNLDQLRGLTWN